MQAYCGFWAGCRSHVCEGAVLARRRHARCRQNPLAVFFAHPSARLLRTGCNAGSVQRLIVEGSRRRVFPAVACVGVSSQPSTTTAEALARKLARSSSSLSRSKARGVERACKVVKEVCRLSAQRVAPRAERGPARQSSSLECTPVAISQQADVSLPSGGKVRRSGKAPVGTRQPTAPSQRLLL